MRGNNEFVYKRFVFQSVFIWNTILHNINTNKSYARFKHFLKDFLLSNDIAFRYGKETPDQFPLSYHYTIYPAKSYSVFMSVLFCYDRLS